jgi:hypothetical protein
LKLPIDLRLGGALAIDIDSDREDKEIPFLWVEDGLHHDEAKVVGSNSAWQVSFHFKVRIDSGDIIVETMLLEDAIVDISYCLRAFTKSVVMISKIDPRPAMWP